MYWLYRLFYRKCICCGAHPYKNVEDILDGKNLLMDAVTNGEIKVSQEAYRKIYFKYHRVDVMFPVCENCYTKIYEKSKAMQALYKAELQHEDKEYQVDKYYEKLAIQVERKELEARAKALGIKVNVPK